ncbi:hypothetical protein VTO73DRAFT_12931 [Trametes versicolor]
MFQTAFSTSPYRDNRFTANLTFDFSFAGEDGKALVPVFGPSSTGLSDFGSSYQIASRSADRRTHPRGSRSAAAPKETNPLAHDSPTPVFQEGVRPTGFKALVGKGHEEFATMRQQDAEEFFTHLVTVLRRHAKKVGLDEKKEPTEVFAFGMEQRLECGDCKRVRYRVDATDTVSVPVPVKEKGKDADGKTMYEDVQLKECLDIVTGTEALEYQCPGCQKKVIATKRTRFATFPEVLVVHAKKFQLVNWVPAKLDIPVILPDSDELQLDEYLGRGLQPGETELPNDDAAVPGLPQFNEAAMAQLEAMGFPAIRCQKALLATGNSDAEAAMEWLFGHMEDPVEGRGVTLVSLLAKFLRRDE